MNKVQKKWSEISIELNEAIEHCKLKPQELATAASIDYYAARRLLKNGCKNRTSAAEKLCSYFEISLNHEIKMQFPGLEPVFAAASEVWDGTVVHANFLREIILSTKSYKVEKKQQV